LPGYYVMEGWRLKHYNEGPIMTHTLLKSLSKMVGSALCTARSVESGQP
jgi:hypothetical protein